MWCPSRHAEETLIITLCSPAPISVSVDHVVDETGLFVRRFVADPSVRAHLLLFFVHVQQPGPQRLLVAALFGHVIAACSKYEVKSVEGGARVGRDGTKRAKGSKCRGVAC